MSGGGVGTGRDEAPDGTTVPWRVLLAEATDALAAAAAGDGCRQDAGREARWLVEEASGLEGAALVVGLDEPATVGGVRRLDAMVARRCAGEPLQYVIGHWPFRTLDLMVDRRVLIPRPETEQVVGAALVELDRAAAGAGTPLVADLGTGSGAIALAVAVERARSRVWATDVDDGALAVARANLAGVGRAATRVVLAAGDWFSALPDELAGRLHLVVSNPPYVGTDEVLPDAVSAWEPHTALVAGPTGREALERVVAEAPRWLAPGGALVVELSPPQHAAVAALATAAGLEVAGPVHDLADRARALVARRPIDRATSGSTAT